MLSVTFDQRAAASETKARDVCPAGRVGQPEAEPLGAEAVPGCCWITGAVLAVVGLAALALMTVLFPSISDFGPEENSRKSHENWDGTIVLVLVIFCVIPTAILLLISCIVLAITRQGASRKACKHLLIAATAITLCGAVIGLTIFGIRASATNERWTRINGWWQITTGILTGLVLIALGIMTAVHVTSAPRVQLPHAPQV